MLGMLSSASLTNFDFYYLRYDQLSRRHSGRSSASDSLLLPFACGFLFGDVNRLSVNLNQDHGKIFSRALVRRASRNDYQIAFAYLECLAVNDSRASPFSRLYFARRIQSPSECERGFAFEHVVNIVRCVVEFGISLRPALVVLHCNSQLHPLAAD